MFIENSPIKYVYEFIIKNIIISILIFFYLKKYYFFFSNSLL